jgi:hypothetical protein
MIKLNLKEFANVFKGESPVIRRVHQSAEQIFLQMDEDVPVARVQITVLDEAGETLAQGEATRGADGCWQFAARSLGKIVIVQAWDLSGNMSKLML